MISPEESLPVEGVAIWIVRIECYKHHSCSVVCELMDIHAALRAITCYSNICFYAIQFVRHEGMCSMYRAYEYLAVVCIFGHEFSCFVGLLLVP